MSAVCLVTLFRRQGGSAHNDAAPISSSRIFGSPLVINSSSLLLNTSSPSLSLLLSPRPFHLHLVGNRLACNLWALCNPPETLPECIPPVGLYAHIPDCPGSNYDDDVLPEGRGAHAENARRVQIAQPPLRYWIVGGALFYCGDTRAYVGFIRKTRCKKLGARIRCNLDTKG